MVTPISELKTLEIIEILGSEIEGIEVTDLTTGHVVALGLKDIVQMTLNTEEGHAQKLTDCKIRVALRVSDSQKATRH